MPEAPRLPSDRDKLAIIGRNGSGKTVAAAWHLSERSWDKMPWFVFNSKRDELLLEISKMYGAHDVSLDVIPKKPGLYFYYPIPGRDDPKVENILWEVWKRGRTGLYMDEGYSVPQGDALNTVLVQGRSLIIPTIILMQRPVFMSKFVLSESNFMQIFDLTHKDDQDTVRKFVPLPNRVLPDLPPYHSLWYDVPRKSLATFGPVPAEGLILERFRDRLAPKRRFI
jgi:hypothetical protein